MDQGRLMLAIDESLTFNAVRFLVLDRTARMRMQHPDDARHHNAHLATIADDRRGWGLRNEATNTYEWTFVKSKTREWKFEECCLHEHAAAPDSSKTSRLSGCRKGAVHIAHLPFEWVSKCQIS